MQYLALKGNRQHYDAQYNGTDSNPVCITYVVKRLLLENFLDSKIDWMDSNQAGHHDLDVFDL